MICGITPINTFLMWHKNMDSIIIKEIMMEAWKNPISTAVSALDMQLSVSDWASRELADMSSYSMACVSLVVMDWLPHGERVLIQRQWRISSTAANEMLRFWGFFLSFSCLFPPSPLVSFAFMNSINIFGSWSCNNCIMRLLICDVFIVLLVEFSRALFLFFFFFLLLTMQGKI